MPDRIKDRIRRGRFLVAAFALVLTGAAAFWGAAHYRLPADRFLVEIGRYALVPAAARLHADDQRSADRLRIDDWVGRGAICPDAPLDTWRRSGLSLALLGVTGNRALSRPVPFVYERSDASYLTDLLKTCDLQEIVAGEKSEYESMLRLGRWMGTRWDHGQDAVPGGSQAFAVSDVVRAGGNGVRFWCEIAAKATVQAATSLGWPARVIAGSSDGYTYEHAVAELWSNRFAKWFVLDTDFNFVVERNGVPLSAWELCRQKDRIAADPAVALRPFAPAKKGVRMPTLDRYLQLFAYIHVDMRNDWHSRLLPRGSPAGGDYATWWTARDELGPVLTAKIRVDDQEAFNWPVNTTWMFLEKAERIEAGVRISIELGAYAPYFESFFVQVDEDPWIALGKDRFETTLSPGTHMIRTRVGTAGGPGSISSVSLRVD